MRERRRMLTESGLDLGSHSTDESYTTYMIAKDMYGNRVPISSASDFYLDINDPDGDNVKYLYTAMVDGVLRVTFDGEKLG